MLLAGGDEDWLVGADDWVGAGAGLFGLWETFLGLFGLGFFLAVVVVDVEVVEDVVFTATWLVLPGLLLLLPHPAATIATAMAEIRTRFIGNPLFGSASG